jgi:isocitrate dehydrogenase kinase/phosphatase
MFSPSFSFFLRLFMPRVYLHHSAATVRYLRQHWPRQPLTEIAAALGIPARKLYRLAEREGFTKRVLLHARADAPGRERPP